MTARPLRIGLLLSLGWVAAGCTATHAVSRTDPEALAQLTENLRGRSVEIEYEHKRERGTSVRVRPGTTEWYAKRTLRTVPTDRVQGFVVDPGLSNTSHAKLGFVAGGALAVAATDCRGFLPAVCYVMTFALGGLVGATSFDIVGDAGEKRIEYHLTK